MNLVPFSPRQPSLTVFAFQTERSINISFSAAEEKEYRKIETSARDFYVDFRRGNRGEVTKHHFMLRQKLGPLFVACSGGYHPLPNGSSVEDEEVEDSSYDFEFTSKFQVLIEELAKTRDSDPSSKYIDLVH